MMVTLNATNRKKYLYELIRNTGGLKLIEAHDSI